MRFYAERPVRATAQLVADVLAILWIVLSVEVGTFAHDLIARLETPAQAIANAGDAIRDTFDGAARTAAGVPLVGDGLASALGAGTGAGASLASAGRGQIDTITTAGTGAGIAIAVLGALPVLLVWLPLRVRYVLAVRSAIAMRDVDTDLLALRAMTRLPVRKLLAVSPDPAAGWRRDDTEVVAGLAALELRSLGLRPSRVLRA
jgi:hypothetical protein